MLAWIGLITILATLLALMSGRLSALVALVLIPSVAALVSGFGPELGKLVGDGVTALAPVVGMFVFAIVYFGLMRDAGLLEPVVTGMVRIVGTDPRRIVIGSTLLALVSHLGGSGAVSFLITIPAMLPLYDRLGIDRRILACSVAMGAGVNILPWSAVTLRASAVLRIPPSELFAPLLLPELVGIAFVIAVSWWLGERERRRIAREANPDLASAAAPVDGPRAGGGSAAGSGLDAPAAGTPLTAEQQALRRPRLFWVNVALTLTMFAILISGIAEPMVVFMIGTVLAMLINYPSPKEQRLRIDAHAKEALMMASVLFAAGVFSGILTGTGMLTALAQAGAGLLSPEIGPHLAVILAVISMPLSLLFDASSFYFGVLPVVAGVGESFGLRPEQIAQAALLGQMTTGFPVSPLSPATFLLVGLAGVDFGRHQRYTIPFMFATTLVMTAAAVALGVFPL